METMRLDRALVERKLIESREKAQELIESGQVKVNGETARKSALKISETDRIELLSKQRYVGRGGLKLEAALEEWKVDVRNRICADVGASTGGFTDCLMQNGAKKVYAIDVGEGQMHPSIALDPRVVLIENINARYLESLPEPVELVTIDVSFISTRLILPAVENWLADEADLILLLKPQFEAPEKTKKGVIKEESVRNRILEKFLMWCQANQWQVKRQILSPIAGEEGNREFLLWMKKTAP